MQKYPPLLLDEWLERIKLLPEISTLLSSNGVLESRYISERQIMSNLIITYTFKRCNWAKLRAEILLRSHRQIEKASFGLRLCHL